MQHVQDTKYYVSCCINYGTISLLIDYRYNRTINPKLIILKSFQLQFYCLFVAILLDHDFFIFYIYNIVLVHK